MNGMMGKILRVDLTDRRVSTIDTADYEEWLGGHGLGSAIFWDLVKDKKIGGFDKGNVLTLMTSPLTGTAVPSAGRMEMQGVGLQSYPTEWFTRSNIGGRIGAMLKFAGWDGIVLEGKAESPIWIDIRDEKVEIRDARNLWGLDSWETQSRLWKEISGHTDFGREWSRVSDNRWTTQRPAVMAIGQAGEKRCRNACIMHEKGHAFGQGGFGAVWGDKKLKAISIAGTNSISVSDPNGLLKAWKEVAQRYTTWPPDPTGRSVFAPSSRNLEFWPKKREARRKGCYGCFFGCEAVYADGKGSGGKCYPTFMYQPADLARHGKVTDASYLAVDDINRCGLSAFEVGIGHAYIKALFDAGELGPGRKIPCDLPFDKYGEIEFFRSYVNSIIERSGIGDDLAEGLPRAAERWGRVKEDLRTGLLDCPYWGYPMHYDPRGQADWGFSSILGDRDMNEHDINHSLFWLATAAPWGPQPDGEPNPGITPENAVKLFSEKTIPYQGDLNMVDFSEENLYSEGLAKLVAWHRHFTRFWRESALFCDFRWTSAINSYAADGRGVMAHAEEPFLEAVTGKKLSIEEGTEKGRKIWNLDNAIWTLQGRHRDQVHFADYIYRVPMPERWPQYLPGREKGKWKWLRLNGRHLDRKKTDDWKTRFYRLEGWDPKTGWPTRQTLKSLQLNQVAEELEKKGRLGVS